MRSKLKLWTSRTILNPRWLMCLPVLIPLWGIAIVPLLLIVALGVVARIAHASQDAIECFAAPTIGPALDAITRWTRGSK